ncbi:glycosyltransferase [Methylomonas koyamae]|nr:glycosyltransferase [Methylomonas koyamae]
MKKEIQLKKNPIVAVYSKNTTTHACSVIRLLQPMLACNWKIIWNTERDCLNKIFDINTTKNADLIVIQREFPSKKTSEILSILLKLDIPIIYDIDDLLLDVQPSHERFFYYKKISPYIKWVIKEVDLVTVSTISLKNELTPHTNRPILVNQNLVNYNLFFNTARPRGDKFNILISGTSTHQNDWTIIREPILEILKSYNDQVRIIFFGDTIKDFIRHKSVNIVKFEPNYNTYAAQLKSLNINIALTPLINNKFNQCKSNIKWLEYSAAGIPGVYSDIAPYNSCIIDKKNGLLAQNNPESWFFAIANLLNNQEKANEIIKNAQKEVLEKYSITNCADKYLLSIQNKLGHKKSVRNFSQTPPKYTFLSSVYSITDRILRVFYKF